MTATPIKLKSGEWGARVKGTARKGDTITITTKSGKSWTATVQAVVWSGNGVTLVATQTRQTRQTSSYQNSGAGSAARVPGYSSWCTGRDNCGCYDCAS